MRPAPIAVFVFKRPEHTKRLLASLRVNPTLADSDVFVFADGPRSDADVRDVEKTREVVLQSGIRSLSMSASDRNSGLAASIIRGVSSLTGEFGRVIVLEDDLVVSPTFLEFMNAALERFRDSPNVFHVSGYCYPITPPRSRESFFLPFVNPWGWATWDRAWKHFDPSARDHARLANDRALRRRFDLDGSFPFFEMLCAQQAGRVDSWFIRWYLSVFAQGGLGLFPAHSLVQNTGFGGDATHTKAGECRQFQAAANAFSVSAFPAPTLDVDAYRRIKAFLRWDLSLPVRATRRILRAFRPTR